MKPRQSFGKRLPALLLFFLLLLAPPLQARVVEQLITVIDGEPYTLSNLAHFAKSKIGREFPTGDLSQINDSDREVLEQFITEKLLEAETREAGIKINDEDIDHYIREIKSKNRLTDEDLKTALMREGHTLASYRVSVKAELEKGELINRQVKKRVNITDGDVERYYKLNAKNYRVDDRVRLSHILLSLPQNSPAAEVQSVMERAEELHKRLAAGENFTKLAEQYSEGAGNDRGGDIGWVKRGTLLKPIEDLAFDTLSVGQVSQPVRTSMGVHLVKLDARETGAALPLSAVRPKIREELYAKALEERFTKWLKTDLRRKHSIDVKLPGVVFKPEDSKEDTMNSLMAARSSRLNRRDDRSLLSYLNPFSYIIKEVPFEDEDSQGPLSDKNIVTLFGIPLFTTDSAEDVPDVLAAPPADAKKNDEGSGQSGGFLDRLNPFKR